MIRILHLCLFSFLISFCSGYRLETSIIVENEQYDWNKFGDLQIVSTVEMVNPLGSQLKPVLMYQILQSNDTSLNSARLLRFQVSIVQIFGLLLLYEYYLVTIPLIPVT